MYEIGPSTKDVDQINSGWTEKDSNTKANFLKIIKNGNIQSNIKKYGLENEEDLYIATKIAVDNYIYNHSPEDVKNYYKFKTGISQEITDRMQRIIEGASKILAEETKEKLEILKEVSVTKKGDFQEDAVNSNYYSIKYEVTNKGEDFLGYDVNVSAIGISDYFIANEEGEENKIEFTSDENVFKIMIPKEYKNSEFEIEVSVTGKFREEKIYRAIEYLGAGTLGDTPNEYVIYEDGVCIENAESIIFTHEKEEDKEEIEKPDDGKQDTEETDKKPNLDNKEDKEPNKEEIKKEKEKSKEDVEIKETATENISKETKTNNQKKLPRTRK